MCYFEGHDQNPESVWQGTFRIFGVDVHCHNLSDGRRIIEQESVEKLLEAMASGNNELNKRELAAFSRWQRGETGE